MTQKPFRLIHLADLQLSNNLPCGFVQESGMHLRLEDSQKALYKAVDYAVENQCKAVLLAGDIFDSHRPDEFAQRVFAEFLAKCCVSGLHVLGVAGQHDKGVRISPLWKYNVLGSMFAITSRLACAVVTEADLVSIHGEDIIFCLVPWGKKDTVLKDLEEAKAWAKKAGDAGQRSVLVGHFTVTHAVVAGGKHEMLTKDTIPPDAFAGHFDYVALGDVHKRQAYYSGSLIRINFGEKDDKKGFNFVEIGPQSGTKTEFVEIEDRPFVELDLREKAWHPDQIPEGSVVKARVARGTDTETLRANLYEAGAVHVAEIIPEGPEQRHVRLEGLTDTGELDLSKAISDYVEENYDPEALDHKKEAVIKCGIKLCKEEEK